MKPDKPEPHTHEYQLNPSFLSGSVLQSVAAAEECTIITYYGFWVSFVHLGHKYTQSHISGTLWVGFQGNIKEEEE